MNGVMPAFRGKAGVAIVAPEVDMEIRRATDLNLVLVSTWRLIQLIGAVPSSWRSAVMRFRGRGFGENANVTRRSRRARGSARRDVLG